MRCVRALVLVALAGGLAAADDTADKLKAKAEFRKKVLARLKGEDAVPPTRTAKPKPTPKPSRSADPTAVAALIDKHIAAKLAAEKVTPAAKASDAEFLRRVSLDLAGVIPSGDEARRFLDDADPAKRARLIDSLLAGDRYGRRLADVWMALLIPTDSDTRFIKRQPFDKWLEDRFNANTPWDAMVKELVTASGSQDENPAVTFFLTNRSVDKLTDAVCQHLLGVQLACAQCHNHPFTDWKQTEYWGMAAFFSKVQPDRVGNPLRGGNTSPGVRELASRSRAKEFFPEGAKTVPAKFLGGDEPKLRAIEPYRPALADWLTTADNPFFAKAMVNRTWFHLFGRGLVNPVDDMHEDNAASHPELLDALATEFARSGFDLKHLIRAIANSQAYQRTSKPVAGDKPDLFARQAVKVMAPEMLFDSLTRVTGFGLPDNRDKAANKSQNLPKGVQFSPRDRFVSFYLAGAETTNPVEYDAGIPQALKLMNNRLLTGGPAVALRYARPMDPVAKNVEALYLATLSRRPTPAEVERVKPLLAKGQPMDRYGDLLWALLNSSEFSTIR
jgi:hypothetical protein